MVRDRFPVMCIPAPREVFPGVADGFESCREAPGCFSLLLPEIYLKNLFYPWSE
jgi:hypothetical protein